jgi:ABC-type multidrug transport system fused ATPase/permease subunit
MLSNLKSGLIISKYFLRIAYGQKPGYFVVTLLQIILKTLIPFINIIFPKLIIDELLGRQDKKLLLLYIFIMFVLNFVGKSLLEGLKCANENYADLLARHFEIEIGKKAMHMDFQFTEDPKLLQQKEKASSGITWYSGGVEGLINVYITIISSFLTLVGVVTIVFMYAHYLLIIIILTVLISSIFQSKMNQVGRKFYDQTTIIDRLFHYVFHDLPDFRYGKDIRLFGAADMVTEKGTHYRNEGKSVWKKQAHEENKYHQVQNFLSFLLDIAMYFYIGMLSLWNRISIGTFSMLITAATTLAGSIKSIVYQLIDLRTKLKYLNEYILYMDYPYQLVKNSIPIPKNLTYTFELREVGFHYPNSDQFVLRHINLTIRPGERLSIVGLNGAGKTTFVKLLTRLYDVSEGEILLNGINIKEYSYEEYQELFSVVFQDFKLFAFSLRENIETDLSLNNDELEAIINESGLAERVAKLPHGVDTSIYKFFDEEGIEPSGGEAQKIAIARALAKRAPIVVLDEPTSALDPIAEYEIYHHFNQLIENKTAIYISHRLSSSRFSDHIVVFDSASIVEYGTHAELIHKQDGIYAKMFETQAQYYLD